MLKWVLWIAILLMVAACEDLVIEQTASTPAAFPVPNGDRPLEEPLWPEGLDKETYRDKILGLLVGSAIGDAMGAPTEMWDRKQIKVQYGYISTLDPVIREGSPEGPWDYNLPQGSTTDDTRWKYLLAKFFSSSGERSDSLDAKAFAKYIVDIYLAEKADVGQVDGFDPSALETEIRHMTWLQEWAKVAQPYLNNDINGYSYALNKFYGGEMSCAGMLYAPMVGAYFPGAPNRAYSEGYKLGLFDLGYARDITALTAAYVAKALQPGVSMPQIWELTRTVDPNQYFKSRLVGRIAHNVFLDAKQISYDAKGIDSSAITPSGQLPANYPYDGLYHARVEKAYELMDLKLQDIAFHANEIHLINLTALIFSEGDFKKALEFVVNYGRDNDTVGAVTGAILGAYWGESKLPAAWSKQVIETSREVVGIDLELLADELVEVAFLEL